VCILQCFELGNPKPHVFSMAVSENKCGSAHLPEERISFE
jgi:hypothetical protein